MKASLEGNTRVKSTYNRELINKNGSNPIFLGVNNLFKNCISFKSQQDTTSFSYERKGDMGLKPIPLPLHKLFLALPKTELHLHLSGSTPIDYIKEIFREEGYSEADIKEKTKIKDNFDNLNDYRATYARVAWAVKTCEHFKEAAYRICIEAAKENVRYLEIRTSLLHKQNSPDEILQAVTDGINKARNELKTKGFRQSSKIIILAQRTGSPDESMTHAKIAAEWAKKPDSLVVGFDIAGNEEDKSIYIHKDAIKYAKEHGLKVTAHAGETHKSGDLTGAQSVKAAVNLGVDRLGHAVFMLDDPAVLKGVAKKQITVESCPTSNVQTAAVKDYEHHPIKQMLDAGVNVALSTDNRTISKTTITNELEQLYSHNVINSWVDVKKLIMNGVKSVFLPQDEKQEIIKKFENSLKELETKPLFKRMINEYLTPEEISFKANIKSAA